MSPAAEVVAHAEAGTDELMLIVAEHPGNAGIRRVSVLAAMSARAGPFRRVESKSRRTVDVPLRLTANVS